MERERSAPFHTRRTGRLALGDGQGRHPSTSRSYRNLCHLFDHPAQALPAGHEPCELEPANYCGVVRCETVGEAVPTSLRSESSLPPAAPSLAR